MFCPPIFAFVFIELATARQLRSMPEVEPPLPPPDPLLPESSGPNPPLVLSLDPHAHTMEFTPATARRDCNKRYNLWLALGGHSRELRTLRKSRGRDPAEFRARFEGMTPTRRLTTLEEFARVAVFMASDQASAMTGTVVNLSAGGVVD